MTSASFERSEKAVRYTTAVSSTALLVSISLYLSLIHDLNPLELFDYYKSLIGTALVAVALASLRPNEGAFNSMSARVVWGGSLAHFFILFMCAGAMFYLDDPKDLGPIVAYSLFAVFYSLLFWVCFLIYRYLVSESHAERQWLKAGSGLHFLSITPLVHLPLYYAALFVSFGDEWSSQNLTQAFALAPEYFVFFDAEPLAFSTITFCLIATLLILKSRHPPSRDQIVELAGIFLLVHACFTFTKVISMMFAMSDPSAITPLMSSAVSGYVAILLSVLFISAILRGKWPKPPGKGASLTAVISITGAYLVFASAAPPEVLLFALVPLIMLATLLAYLSSLESNIKQRTNELEAEKRKTEALLSNILPQHVVQELKEKGASSPKYFDDVSVMFTDFVGFTEIAQRLTPTQLIEQLNEIFTGFDAIVERHQSERIKTIGDAYMCVSGLSGSASTPAKNLICAGSEILKFIYQFNQENDTSWEIRVGIASGGCVAGIVGTNKYQFDLFGDTVNTAARMEAYSSPGLINIDEQTYLTTKNEPDLTLEARPLTHVKGKGDQNMYFVALATELQQTEPALRPTYKLVL